MIGSMRALFVTNGCQYSLPPACSYGRITHLAPSSILCTISSSTGDEIIATLPWDRRLPRMHEIIHGADAFAIFAVHLEGIVVSLHVLVCDDVFAAQIHDSLRGECAIVSILASSCHELYIPWTLSPPDANPEASSDAINMWSWQLESLRQMERVEALAAASRRYAANLHVSGEWFVDPVRECFTRDPCWQKVHICGGILADHAGSGKTATVLRHCCAARPDAAGRPDALTSRGALIIVPLNLLQHWLSEATRWCPRATILPMFLAKHARQFTMQDLLQADIVLSTVQFLRDSKTYHELCENEIQRVTNFERRDCRSKTGFAALGRRFRDVTVPVIEAVRWRRMVVDEVHELKTNPRLMKTLRMLRAAFYWGISATPDTDSQATEHLYRLTDGVSGHQPNLLHMILRECIVRSSSPDVRPCVQNLRLVHMNAADRDTLMSEAENVPDMIWKSTCATVTDSVEAWHRDEIYRVHSAHIRASIIETSVAILVLQGSMDDAAGTLDAVPLQDTIRELEVHIVQQHERIRFVESSITTLGQRSDTCPICMDAPCGTITVCGHLFCRKCIADHMRRGSLSCPTCRQFIGHTKGVIIGGQASSRMMELVDLLLHLAEPTIVFVQWKVLLKNMRAILRGSQLRVFTLEGNAAQRAKTLDVFADVGGVLLLTLEQPFSGLHLPHVRHVVFTHAIVGSDSHVRAMEYQAISRCLRHGQTGCVSVHSFVVSDVVEEDMWRAAHRDVCYATIAPRRVPQSDQTKVT